MTLLESGPSATELIIQGQVRFLGKLGEFGEPIIRKQADAVAATFVRNVAAHFEGAAITQQAAVAPQAAITSLKTPRPRWIGVIAGLVAGLLMASVLPASSPAVTWTLRATVVLALMLMGAKAESHLRHSSES